MLCRFQLQLLILPQISMRHVPIRRQLQRGDPTPVRRHLQIEDPVPVYHHLDFDDDRDDSSTVEKQMLESILSSQKEMQKNYEPTAP